MSARENLDKFMQKIDVNGLLTPTGIAAQTKIVSSVNSPVPDYLGQQGIDVNGKKYVAISLTGIMWSAFVNYQAGKNRFNGNIIINTYVNSSYFLIESITNWATTDYQLVRPSTSYHISGNPRTFIDVIFYDSSKIKISGARGNNFTTPVGCTYIRWTLYDNASGTNISSVQLEVGIVATAYEPYVYGDTINIDDLSDVTITSPLNNQALKYNSTTGVWENKAESGGNSRSTTLLNSNKIAFYGSSYTESYYALKNKSWVNKLAQLTDYICANFGVSGNRLVDEVSRLRANSNPFHTTIGIKTLNPTYISFANVGNETLLSYGNNLDGYKNELLLAIEAIKAIGSIPILGTEHFGSANVEFLLNQIADEQNLLVSNIGTVSSKVISNAYAGFWGGSHPASRTNAHYFTEWMYLLSRLPQPQRSIKLFRVRSEYKAGSPALADLHYDNNLQRVQFYQEINCGEYSLKEANGVNGWEYYDRLNENFASDLITNEYCKLINSENVAFANWVLAEIIIDRLSVDSLSLNISVDALPTGIYLANNNSTATQYTENVSGAAFRVTKTVYDSFAESAGTTFTSDATGAATLTYRGKVKSYALKGYYLLFDSSVTAAVDAGAGNLTKSGGGTTAYIEHVYEVARHKYFFLSKLDKPWSRFEDASSFASYAGGVLTLSLTSDFEKYLRKDKVRVLLYKSATTLNISGISASYEGGVEKQIDKVIEFKPKPGFTELNTTTGFDTDWITVNNWVNTGATLEQMPSGQRDYPPKHNLNYHIKLDYDATDSFPNTIKKSFTITASEGYRRIIVRVIARLFPKIFNAAVSEDDYHTQTRQIKADSYDYGKLCCALGTAEPYAISKKLVDIGWSEVVFETYIPPYATAFDLLLYRDENDFIDTDNYRNHLYPMQVYDVSVQTE